MPEPRLPPVDPSTLDKAQQRVYDAIAGSRGRVAGPFIALLHSPELADRVQHLGAFLRYDSSLDPRHSELAILVVARAWTCAFEWVAHVPHAIAAGVPEAVIDDIRAGRRPESEDPRDGIIADVVIALVRTGRVPDDPYEAARSTFGTTTLVELVGLVGYYSLLAMTINAHAIPPTDGSSPFTEP